MTFQKAKEEYKWKQWKAKEEKVLREFGMSEEKIIIFENWIGKILMQNEGFGNIIHRIKKNYICKEK